MEPGDALRLLSLPSEALTHTSQPALCDALGYFEPDILTIPGARNALAYAAVRETGIEAPVLHPQLGRNGERVTHHRYIERTGLHEATEAAPPAEAIDIIAVQDPAFLSALQSELESGGRRTGTDAATYLIVPELAVSWNTTTLSTTLPHSEQLAAISAALSEPVTILAGGQPATYHHVWTLPYGHASITVPVAGLGATDTETGPAKLTAYACTAHGTVAAEVVTVDAFGLRALQGVGEATAERLSGKGCQTREAVRNLGVSELAELPGVGRERAEKMHAHASVIASGEPLVLTNSTPAKTRDGRPPLCLDIETDGLSPTIIWQFGIYDPHTDRYQSFVEKQDPKTPKRVLEAFIEWFLANHSDRTVITWNGYGFDYVYIEQFLRRYLPQYVEAWDDVWTYDLYKWAVRDGNALLPGRTNKLDHVARALGYESAETGLTGAQTAAAYQAFMREPENPAAEPDWDRHEQYCRDDCEALWYVYRAIETAERRDVTDSGTGGAAGEQAGLMDF